MADIRTVFTDRGYTVDTEPADRHNRTRFVLHRDGNRIGQGTYFRGSRHITPWIEFKPAIRLDPDSDTDQQLFTAFTDLLVPGSHLMVHYLQDTATADALTADVPPPATPIGFLQWQAGVRWYKDWYFTEGWMEGSQKLQGNLPVDDETRVEREDEWWPVLRQFCERETAFTGCQDRAAALLAQR